MANKQVKWTLSADNNPAIQALNEVAQAVGRINTAFKNSKKAAGAGSGGMFDPKELNSIGDSLNSVNDILKNMTVTQNQWQRDAGFKGLKEGFSGVSQSVKGLFGDMMALMSPIEALTGAGIVAGLARVANGFNQNSTKVKTTSYETGIAGSDIQRLMNQGKTFGIDNDVMRSGLTGFSQTMREIALHGGPLLGALSNQLGVQNVRERYDSPGGPESLMKETMDAINRVGSSNPAMRNKMIEAFGLDFMKPVLMASPDIYKKQTAFANEKLFNPTDREREQGYKNDLAINNFWASLGSLWSRIGSSSSNTLAGAARQGTRILNGDVDSGDALDPIRFGSQDNVLDQKIRNKWRNWKSELGSYFRSPYADIRPDDQESVNGLGPSGIAIPGPPPPEKELGVLNVNITGAPPGTTVTTTPDSRVKIRPTINHAGFSN